MEVSIVMKRTIALFCATLFLLFSQGASAETLMSGNEFQITLPDSWHLLDEVMLSQIVSILPQTTQQTASIAYNDSGSAICAFSRPSEGMTMELMSLFQSAYIARIEKALPFFEMENLITGTTAFSTNKFFYISFTVLETPVWVLYNFTGESVITVCTVGMEIVEVTNILSTLTTIPVPTQQ